MRPKPITFHRNKVNILNPILVVRVRWIIRLAWGPRRISSRALPGTKAYPEELTANLSLWFKWFRQNTFRKKVYIVVTAQGADYGADYMALVAKRDEERRLSELRIVMTSERIAEIQAQRQKARSARDFALADRLRDELIEAGVVVGDQSL